MLDKVYKVQPSARIVIDSRRISRTSIPPSWDFPSEYLYEFSKGDIVSERILLAANYDIDKLIQTRKVIPLGVKEVNIRFKRNKTKMTFIVTSIGKQVTPEFHDNAVNPFEPEIHWANTYWMVTDDGSRSWKAIKTLDAGVLT